MGWPKGKRKTEEHKRKISRTLTGRERKNYPRHGLPVNEEYFDELNTAEKWYWLGFLHGDGHMYYVLGKGEYLISMGLQVSDIGHVKKFKEALCAGQKITRVKNAAVISIRSKHMARKLYELGLCDKLYTAIVPIQDFARDYWRGFLDADGGVYLRDGKPSLGLCGTEDNMALFSSYMHEQTGYRMNIHGHDRHAYIRNVACGGWRYAYPMIELLYKDSCVSLDRKQAVADEIMRLHREQ